MLVDEPESARRPPRVRSLDVVRGFAVLLMIFVDDAGSAYAVLDHSPWDGLTIADVVMPFFIFMVGVSAALALGGGKRTLAPVLRRGATLWVVGVAVQGGGLPDPTTYAWGYDLGTVRWCGILQRIAACYVVASFLVLCCARRAAKGAKFLTSKAHISAGGGLATADDGVFFGALALLVAAYLAMTYLTPVPTYRVAGPASPAAGSAARSGPASAPAWCAAPGVADPEGFLSGVLAVATAVIGALFARCLERCRARRAATATTRRRLRLVDGDGDRRGALMLHWALASLALAAAALVAVAAGSPVNKQLWTPSYCLATAALCGFALTAAVALLGDLADGGDDAKFRAARASRSRPAGRTRSSSSSSARQASWTRASARST
ncbi:heparan-alpha-glucosaminide N-acetyltransferase [Aureococcus anophagefferens]|nr:heparan-alpha-glucosaminide N-acetyltransferase [Aureococcus anophagefferens]